jgi:hypothetical protein
MGTSTFSGPLQAGTVRQGPYENISPVELTAIVPITVTAVASTDFVVYLPAYSTVTTVQNYTGTAFTGATVTVALGSTAGGTDYVQAAQTIKAATTTAALATILLNGFGSYTTVGSGLMNLPADATATAANNGIPTAAIYIRVAQTSPTAVGSSTLIIKYTQNP